MHIEAYETKLACKTGEIVKVTGGDGEELCRPSCSISKHFGRVGISSAKIFIAQL